MEAFLTLVLAAGRGTRMHSPLPKVLQPLCGRSLLEHVVRAAAGAGSNSLWPILGHGREAVEAELAILRDSVMPSIQPIWQKDQKGTGHAVQCALQPLEREPASRTVVILSGDGPLLQSETLRAFVAAHGKSKAALTLGVMELENPTGYGRAVGSGRALKRIVEERDASPKEKLLRTVNGGVYVTTVGLLREFLPKLKPSKNSGELYLTDLVALAAGKRKKVEAWKMPAEELLGVNDMEQLAAAGKVMRKRILRNWLLAGVRVVDPENTYVDAGVTCEAGAVIEPGAVLLGNSSVGAGAVVKAYSSVEDAVIEAGAQVGPYARLRPGSRIGAGAKIGNFVETKKTVIGKGSKVSHLSYVGDAEVGAGVNIGCGFITCNYDGVQKHTTVIEDGAFIGSDVQAVAPVRIGRDSYVASGTTLTKEVPADALAIARVKQENKAGYAARLRGRQAARAKKEG